MGMLTHHLPHRASAVLFCNHQMCHSGNKKGKYIKKNHQEKSSIEVSNYNVLIYLELSLSLRMEKAEIQRLHRRPNIHIQASVCISKLQASKRVCIYQGWISERWELHFPLSSLQIQLWYNTQEVVTTENKIMSPHHHHTLEMMPSRKRTSILGNSPKSSWKSFLNQNPVHTRGLLPQNREQ